MRAGNPGAVGDIRERGVGVPEKPGEPRARRLQDDEIANPGANRDLIALTLHRGRTRLGALTKEGLTVLPGPDANPPPRLLRQIDADAA